MYFFFSSRRLHTICSVVTGVQTCALPISLGPGNHPARIEPADQCDHHEQSEPDKAVIAKDLKINAVSRSPAVLSVERVGIVGHEDAPAFDRRRSEERRVGKGWGRTCRLLGSAKHTKKENERIISKI